MGDKTGGPAFPQVDTETVGSHGEYQDRVYSYGGMTLRDYFAAKAMQGRHAAGHNRDGDDCSIEALIAYQMADAMLAARGAA